MFEDPQDERAVGNGSGQSQTPALREIVIEDVWSRTEPRYRRRAAALLLINAAVFAGLNVFAYWLQTLHAFDFDPASYRDAMRNLSALTGRALKRLCVVGGGSRNRLLCQMAADATGLEVIAGPAEATVVGNLAVQALATGALEGNAGVRELVRSSFRFRRYKPTNEGGWGRHASRYAEIGAKSKQVV